MNPVPLFLIIVTLPLLLGGCGGKDESTNETKHVEEKALEVKEEVKTEESLAETEHKLEGVKEEELEFREDISYLKGSDTPYTGKFYGLYENGKKEIEGNVKNGKQDGLWVGWHLNGQKRWETNYKDGVEISAKFWNNKGELISETFSTPKD